jgi:O-antigen ligase
MYAGVPGFDEKALTSGNENTWLGILVDLGLVGLLPYAMIVVLLIRSDVQILRRHDGEEQLARPFAAVALAMMVYTVINASTGDLRFQLYPPCFAFLVQGIAARLGKRTQEAPANIAVEDLEPIAEGTY